MLTPEQVKFYADLNANHRCRSEAWKPSFEGEYEQQAERILASRSSIIWTMLNCRIAHRMWPKPLRTPRVLDVGCSNGPAICLLEPLLRCHAAKPEYFGLEIVKSMIDIAIDNYPGRTFWNGPLENAPAEWNGSFDFIYSYHVFEHLRDPNDTAATLKRLLAPNGVVGAVTPHYFPDEEEAHVTKLRMEEWIEVYRRAGLKCAYGMIKEYALVECHLVLTHAEWPWRT